MVFSIYKKTLLLFATFAFSFFLANIVSAVWNGTFYEPGDTLNPECLPTDVDCDVRSPLTSLNIDDSIYGAGWNADATHAPSKNAIYDKIESLGSGGTWGSITGTLSSQTDLQNILNLKATLASPTFTGTVTIPTGAIFNTPASMVGTNITGTASGLSIGGSAATLTTARAIYGNNFDGSAALTQIIASTFGGTGNGFTKFTGPTTAERTFTLPDSSATLLYSGGALGTPSSGTVTNLTGTASININGTVGATTPTTGAFTTATASTSVSTPSLITASGALTVTPAAGSNLNVSLATTGDFAVNTNQLYVDTSAASVGIGTTSPNMALHLESSLLGSYGMRIKNTSAASGFASATYIAENDAGYTGQLFKTSSGYTGYKTVAANDLGFYNTGSGNISILNDYSSGNINFAAGGSSTAQMTLLSTGNFGIGISPTAFLHLKAGTATANTAPLKFTAGTNLSTTEAGAIEYDGTHLYFTAANAGTRYQLDQQPVAVGSITGLGTGVSTALAVNVGSAGAFVVNGGALGTPSSGTVTNLTGTASININGTVGATTPTTGAFTTATASTSVSTPSLITASGSLIITPASGNVGIGTTNPVAMLTVGGTQSGNAGFEIVPGSGIVFQTYNRTSSAYTSMKFDSLTFGFRPGGSEKVTIDSSGNVGIGDTTPDALLEAESSTVTGGNFLVTNTGIVTSGNVASVVANSLTTGNAFNISTNAITTGKGLSLSSSSTAFTGDLQNITFSGSNAANTGSLLALDNTGTSNTNTTLYIKHYATGTNNLALRIDDVSGDTTPFVVDGTGSVGIGITSPSARLSITGAGASTGRAFTIANSSNVDKFTVLDDGSVNVTGLITSSYTGETFRGIGGGTSAMSFRLGNTGGDVYFGQEGSSAGGFFTGSLAYSTVIYSTKPIQNIIGGVARTIIDTAGNFGIGDTTPDALLEAESATVTGGNFLVTNTGIVTSGNVASVVANSLTTGVASAISTTGQTTGTGLSITGGGVNLLAGGELLDLQMGAATVGNAINIVNSGAYTGTGLVNITANGLTTGTAINVPHTTSVIANGGSLARLSSTSIDTSTTTGVLLDLSSTASLAGTQFLQTYSGLTTGIGEKIVANALTTGTAFIIPHTTSVIANGGSLARLSSTSIDTSTTTGVLLDLSSTASLAGTQFLQTYSGLTTGIGQSIVANALTSGSMLNLSSSGTGGLTNQKGLNISLAGTNGTAAQTTYGAYISNTHAGTTSTNVGLYVTASGGTTANYALQAVGDISLTGGLTTIDNLAMGAMVFETDSGIISWVDMPVTSSAAVNTVESYTAQIDGNPLVSVYGVSDGAGSVKNLGVGIGTATPLLRLDVAGSGRFTGTATSVLTGSIDPAASTTVTGVSTLFTTELVVGDRITVTGETRTVTAIASATSLTVDTAFSNNANDTSPDKLAAVFIARDSSNTVKMVINDLGNIGIGTTAPAYALDVLASGTGVIARFNSSNSTSCTLATDGTISCTSDISLKKNIKSLDGEDFTLSEDSIPEDTSVLNKFRIITPVTYNWNSELDTDTKHIGFIAQDVERAFPGIVVTNPVTGLKSLGYTNFIPYTIKAIQELDLNLEGIAGLTTPVPGSPAETFVTSFFNNIFAKISTWLASATNGITNIFAGEVETKSLCVADDAGGKTCITKTQLDALILNAGISTPEPAPVPETTPPPSDGGTPPPTGGEENPAPEPEPQPEADQPPAEAPEPEPAPEPVPTP